MIDRTFEEYKALFDEHLLDFIPDIDSKSITLYDSMKYSLSAGGKRLRPVLLMAACEFCGGKAEEALPYAGAMEYLHTYSLIHDDMPCMDDDDLRRGMPTNHIIYGEAVATLAGDGLQSAAYEAMQRDMLLYFDNFDALKSRIRAAYEIVKGAGVTGMVAGQIADVEAENKKCSKELLNYIHITKTASMIKGAVRAGARLGGCTDKELEDLTLYAENLGLAFQVCDDILDVEGDQELLGKEVGHDEANCKATYPALYGLEESKKKFRELTDAAKEALADYYDNAELFVDLAEMLYARVY